MRLKAPQLAWLIDRTGFVVCPDDNRYGINGAHLEVHDGHDGQRLLRMVATDGHRLSYAQAPFEATSTWASGCSCPARPSPR
jgi:DNA polymerase III sliding clamp (beta) subunit (PCNA family)